MKKLAWSNELNLGVRQVDDQHKRLVQLANNLISAVQDGAAEEILDFVFKELREYTVFHFRDEEGFMEEIGFPGRAAHAARHRDLKAQVKQYQRSLYEKQDISPGEVLAFLRGWLVDHIIYDDMEIAKYMKGKRQKDAESAKDETAEKA